MINVRQPLPLWAEKSHLKRAAREGAEEKLLFPHFINGFAVNSRPARHRVSCLVSEIFSARKLRARGEEKISYQNDNTVTRNRNGLGASHFSRFLLSVALIERSDAARASLFVLLNDLQYKYGA